MEFISPSDAFLASLVLENSDGSESTLSSTLFTTRRPTPKRSTLVDTPPSQIRQVVVQGAIDSESLQDECKRLQALLLNNCGLVHSSWDFFQASRGGYQEHSSRKLPNPSVNPFEIHTLKNGLARFIWRL